LLQVFLTAASSTHQVCHAKVVAYVETAWTRDDLHK